MIIQQLTGLIIMTFFLYKRKQLLIGMVKCWLVERNKKLQGSTT